MSGEEIAAGPGRGAAASEDARTHGASGTDTAAAVERASRLDAGWFRRHPARARHVRLLIKEEELTGPEPRRPCACEECAADLWRQAAPERCKAFAPDAAAIALRARP